jgi:probable HAF family extracellular repeat protein
LGTLGGANGEALAINKNGQVVGDSDTTEGPTHAFIFDHSELKDLGTLPGFENASHARGITILATLSERAIAPIKSALSFSPEGSYSN